MPARLMLRRGSAATTGGSADPAPDEEAQHEMTATARDRIVWILAALSIGTLAAGAALAQGGEARPGEPSSTAVAEDDDVDMGSDVGSGAESGETPPTAVPENGLFAVGRAGAPGGGWQHQSYFADEAVTRFLWTVGAGGAGVATIASARPNDARWFQRVRVEPSTWYLVSGWVRTEEVGDGGGGACLALSGGYRQSRQLRGTTGWRHVSFWVQTEEQETALDIECRIGGASALNTGTVHCTAIAIEPAGHPGRDGPLVYRNSTVDPMPRRIALAGIGALALGGMALLAWRFLLPPAARIPP